MAGAVDAAPRTRAPSAPVVGLDWGSRAERNDGGGQCLAVAFATSVTVAANALCLCLVLVLVAASLWRCSHSRTVPVYRAGARGVWQRDRGYVVNRGQTDHWGPMRHEKETGEGEGQ